MEAFTVRDLNYACNHEAMKSTEVMDACYGDPEEWLWEMLVDLDIVTYLFSGIEICLDEAYHFSRWDEPQFTLIQPYERTLCCYNDLTAQG